MLWQGSGIEYTIRIIFVSMTTATVIEKLKSPEIRSVFARNHVRHAYLTGSFARGEAKESSDLDIIYVKEA